MPKVFILPHMPKELTDIIDAQSEAAAHRHQLFLWPRQWLTYPHVHNWQLFRLDAADRDHIPDVPGVYTLLAIPNVAGLPSCSYPMYVGQSVSLHKRFGDYLNKERRQTGRPKVFRFLNLYSDHTWFCFTSLSAQVLDAVEDGIRDALMPPLNDDFSGYLSKVVGAL